MKFLAQLFFRFTLLPLARVLYRVRTVGAENVPQYGGVLLLSNHVSYIDSFIIYLVCPRRVRFLFLEDYTKFKIVGWFFDLFGGIPIRPDKAKEAIQRTAQALIEGQVVCVFAEGELTRTGVPCELKRGFELIARKAKCPVVPVFMDGLWGSIFSYERGKYIHKIPRGLTCPLQVAFGKELTFQEAKKDLVLETMLSASVEAFTARRELERPLEVEVVRALKRHGRQLFLVEQGKSEPREWTRTRTLGLAMAMARRWMASPPEGGDRVAILLPPGPTPALIGLGLFLAGKTPVFLPFTLDQDEMEAVSQTATNLGIKTVITSKAFMPHYMDFWPGDEAIFIDMRAVLSDPGRGILSMENLRAIFEPAWLANWRLDLNIRVRDREAIGLIVAPGEDAVFLSSEELHRNALQISSVNFVQRDETIFCETSMSRAAGIQLGFWAPLLSGGTVISRSLSRREDSELLADLVLRYGVTLLSGTPEFFKKIKLPLSIESLSHGVVFDEINAFELEDCEKIAQVPLCRAWESHGRVVTMSCPDPNDDKTPPDKLQIGGKPQSVGRFLPGIAGKIVEGTLFIRFASGRSGNNGEKGGLWIDAGDEAKIDNNNFVYLVDLEGQ